MSHVENLRIMHNALSMFQANESKALTKIMNDMIYDYKDKYGHEIESEILDIKAEIQVDLDREDDDGL